MKHLEAVKLPLLSNPSTQITPETFTVLFNKEYTLWKRKVSNKSKELLLCSVSMCKREVVLNY